MATLKLKQIFDAQQALARLFNDTHPTGKGSARKSMRIAAMRNQITPHIDDKSPYAVGRKTMVEQFVAAGRATLTPEGGLEFKTWADREAWTEEFGELADTAITLELVPLGLDDLDDLNITPSLSPAEIGDLVNVGAISAS